MSAWGRVVEWKATERTMAAVIEGCERPWPAPWATRPVTNQERLSIQAAQAERKSPIVMIAQPTIEAARSPHASPNRPPNGEKIVSEAVRSSTMYDAVVTE